MSSQFVCSFCNKTLSTKSNLNIHVNTSKRCIQSRSLEILKCESSLCHFTTTIQSVLQKHQKQCDFYVQYKEEQVAVLKNENSKLNLLLEKEMKKSTVVNNNNNNNSKTSTITHNKQTNNHLSIEVRDNFIKNVGEPIDEFVSTVPQYIKENFTVNKILGDTQDVYDIFIDTATYKKTFFSFEKNPSLFYYKDRSGNIKPDIRGQRLITSISEPLKEIREECANSEIRRLKEDSDNFVDNAERNTKNIREINKRAKIIENIEKNDKTLRKNIAEKLYIPPHMLNEYREDPKKLLEYTENLLEKPLFEEHFNREIIGQIFEVRTEDELDEVYRSMESYCRFIIQNFLVSNCQLVYNYDKSLDKFFYYTAQSTGGDNTSASGGLRNNTSQSSTSSKNTYIKYSEEVCSSLYEYLFEKAKVHKSQYIDVPDNVLNDIKNINTFSKYMKKYLSEYQALFNKV